MKEIFLALILLTTSIFTINGQEKIEWSANQKLTVNDFKGTPPDPSTRQSLIARNGIETKLDGPEIKNLKTFNRQITNYFYPNDSWVLWTDKGRLRYFLTLFDINEWMARELRKRCNQNRQQVLMGEYKKISDEVQSEFVKIREQYDGESEYGTDIVGQVKWETKITEMLNSLSNFCRTCEN
jgi:hypothetical protein